MIAFDIETKDPGLKLKYGDGSIRKDGEILTICAYDGQQVYYTDKEDNKDNDKILRMLDDENEVKVGHNVIYDVTWLQNGYNVPVRGRIEDTMTREGLLNEFHDKYKLDDCCKRHNVQGKNYNDTVEAWYKENGFKGKAIENLDKVPADVRVKYCAQDVKATYELFQKQKPQLTQWSLDEVNDLECSLIPMLMEFKKNGIRIDTKLRDEMAMKYMTDIADAMETLESEYGLTSLSSPKQKAEAFHRLGIKSDTTTASGNESFNYKALADIDHPLAQILLGVTKKNTALTKFLNGCLRTHAIGDRIHTTFYPTLRDDGGTITGRFSSREPNLQNVSTRDKVLEGGDLRALFIPDEDHVLGAFDYKQVEYYLFAHYAIGRDSDRVRQMLIDGMDYHDMAVKVLGWTGKDARIWAKTFNFGVLYGLGLHGFQDRLRWMFQREAKQRNMLLHEHCMDKYGMSYDDYTAKILNDYYQNMPFVRPSCEAIKAVAKSRGYVRSIGGRIHHKPPDGGIYKIVNYLIQGSAADIMKLGLRRAWESGVFSVLHAHLTVHDELVFSIPRTKAGVEAAKDLAETLLLRDLKIKVPLKIDTEVGPNWGACTKENWEQFCKEVR